MHIRIKFNKQPVYIIVLVLYSVRPHELITKKLGGSSIS